MDRVTTLIFCAVLMVVFYLIVLGLIFADLESGIRKAKQRRIQNQ